MSSGGFQEFNKKQNKTELHVFMTTLKRRWDQQNKLWSFRPMNTYTKTFSTNQFNLVIWKIRWVCEVMISSKSQYHQVMGGKMAACSHQPVQSLDHVAVMTLKFLRIKWQLMRQQKNKLNPKAAEEGRTGVKTQHTVQRLSSTSWPQCKKILFFLRLNELLDSLM